MTKKDKPRVLVVIPTLGARLEYLEIALKSIRDQNIAADVAVVYPLSNKKASAVIKKYKAIEIDDPGSMSGAVNEGIKAAKPWHEYIVWIGDDDILYPNSLKTTSETLDKNPLAAVAFGYCDYVDENGKKIFSSRAGSLAPWIMTWGPDLVPMMGLMMRKSSIDKAGLFNVDLKWAMDLDMLLRLKQVGKFVNTKTTLSAFRWHSTSQTVTSRPKVLDETEKIKRKYLSNTARSFAFLWEKPVRIATKIAVKNVNSRARRLNTNSPQN